MLIFSMKYLLGGFDLKNEQYYSCCWKTFAQITIFENPRNNLQKLQRFQFLGKIYQFSKSMRTKYVKLCLLLPQICSVANGSSDSKSNPSHRYQATCYPTTRYQTLCYQPLVIQVFARFQLQIPITNSFWTSNLLFWSQVIPKLQDSKLR